MWRSKAAVVVLPLVPVITTVPSLSARESLVRIAGSTQRETSPGSVVPPPRRRPRLRLAVSLPAQSAALVRAFIFAFHPPLAEEGQGGGPRPADTTTPKTRAVAPPSGRLQPRGGSEKLRKRRL